jgi:acetyl-CoA synthetase
MGPRSQGRDVLWTTADPGWVTGTVYGAFAPWLCGVESFIRAGRFEIEGWCRSVEMNRVPSVYSADRLPEVHWKERSAEKT